MHLLFHWQGGSATVQRLSEARAVKELLRESREELAMGRAVSLTSLGSAHIPGATA